MGTMLACVLAATAGSVSVWVSPTGQDSNPGTRSQPVQSIASGVEIARARAAGSKATVNVLPGDYTVRTSIKLGFADSNLTIVGSRGARLLGGTLLKRWSAVKDENVLNRLTPEAKHHVLQSALTDEPGQFVPQGFGAV